jgi:hypothetical protein
MMIGAGLAASCLRPESAMSAYATGRIGGDDPLRSHSGFRLDRGS